MAKIDNFLLKRVHPYNGRCIIEIKEGLNYLKIITKELKSQFTKSIFHNIENFI